MESFGRARAPVLAWADQGLIAPDRLRDALAIAGVTPGPRDWRWFLDRLLLWAGALLFAAAALFFIAFNWTGLGRFTRFGLIEALIVAAVAVFWRLDSEHRAAKAALTFAAAAMGGLLALYGQTYQTGADTWELFAWWSLLILPWALVGRFSFLWMLWLLVTNLAIGLYFVVIPQLFGVLINLEREVWALFIFNIVALVAWETALQRWTWMDGRWGPRLLALASGGFITILTNGAITGAWDSSIGFLVYLAWLVCSVAIYRKRIADLFMIATACLSLIITVSVYMAEHLMDDQHPATVLLTGLIVIGMSAVSAYWLKGLAQEQQL